LLLILQRDERIRTPQLLWVLQTTHGVVDIMSSLRQTKEMATNCSPTIHVKKIIPCTMGMATPQESLSTMSILISNIVVMLQSNAVLHT